MSEITVETIVLLVSFVLPGYLTILVSKALYHPDKPLSDLEITYKIIYLTSVRELEGKIVKKIYAEEYGMIVDITKLDGFSIFYD